MRGESTEGSTKVEGDIGLQEIYLMKGEGTAIIGAT